MVVVGMVEVEMVVVGVGAIAVAGVEVVVVAAVVEGGAWLITGLSVPLQPASNRTQLIKKRAMGKCRSWSWVALGAR